MAGIGFNPVWHQGVKHERNTAPMDTSGTLFLPVLVNGVRAVGDIWDERSQRFTGLNLFCNTFSSLPENDLVFTDVSSENEVKMAKMAGSHLMNKLGVDASVSVSIMGGFIKAEGGLSFDIGSSQSSNEEELHWAWFQDNTKAKLKEFSSDDVELRVDPYVRRLLEAGTLSATHVVDSITLGGEACGTMRVSQKNTSNTYKLGASLEANMDLAVLSVAVKASVEVSEGVSESNYSSSIKLQSVPPVKAPVDVLEFDSLSDKIQDVMTRECHYENKSLLGLPRRFSLVPLHVYLPGLRRARMYKSISDRELEGLFQALTYLGLITDTEFIKKSLLARSPRMLKLLHDPIHVLSTDVAAVELRLQKVAKAFKTKLLAAFMTDKAEGRNALSAQLSFFEDWKESVDAEVEAKVAEKEAEAKDELLAVKLVEQDNKEFDKLEERIPLQLFTNAEALSRWLSSERMMKILYMTRLCQLSNGIPTRLYYMSLAMGKLKASLAVSYPSVSPDDRRLSAKLNPTAGKGDTDSRSDARESMFIQTLSQDYRIRNESDMLLLTSVLEAAAGVSRPGARRLFSIYAELLGIPLPMDSSAEYAVTLYELLRTQLSGVLVCETETETMKAIDDKADTWKLVFPLEGLHSVTDVVRSLAYINSMRANTNFPKNTELILGTFERTSVYEEVPILFLFKSAQLRAACLDPLDLLILISEFTGGQNFNPLIPASMVDNCFSLKRLPYALEVAGIYPASSERTEQAPAKLRSNPPASRISQALEVCTALLENPAEVALEICSALARIYISLCPEFGFKDYWNYNESCFKLKLSDYDGWAKLLSQIDKEIKLSSISDSRVTALEKQITEFESLIQRIESDTSLEAGKPDREVQARILQVLSLSWPDSESDVLAELKGIRVLSAHAAVKAGMALTQFEMLRSAAAGLESEEMFHLRLLRQTVAQVQETQSVSRESLHKLLQTYTSRISFPDEAARLKSVRNSSQGLEHEMLVCLRNRSFFRLQRLLVLGSQTPLQNLLTRAFERFDTLSDSRNLVRLFNDLKDEGASEEAFEKIWNNDRFLHLVSEQKNAESRLVLLAIKELHCRDNKIPKYIPEAIAQKLLPLLSSSAGFSWAQEWLSMDTARGAFQTLLLRRSLPDTFPRVLLENMLQSRAFREALLKTQAVHFWDDLTECFSQPWDFNTLEIILKAGYLHRDVLLAPRLGDPYKQSPLERRQSSPGALSPDMFYLVKPSELLSDDLNSPLSVAEKLKRGMKASEIFANRGMVPHGECVISRVDGLTELFNSILDPWLQRRLLLKLACFNEALPLLVRNAETPTTLPRSLLGVLNGMEVGASGDFKQSLLFKSSYRMVTALRVGQHAVGKSSLLNHLFMTNPECFVSRDWGSSHGVPKALKGFMELAILSEQSARAKFWNDLPGRDSELMLLGNLHGDALELPLESLQILSQITTCFVIFWMPQSYEEITRYKAKLARALTVSVNSILDIFVLPTDPEIITNIPPELCLTAPLISPINAQKVSDILLAGFKESHFSKFVGTDELITTPEAEEFVSFIRKKSVAHVRGLLELQRSETNTLEQIEKQWAQTDYVQVITLFCRAAVSSRAALSHIAESLEILTHSGTRELQVHLGTLTKLLEDGSAKRNIKSFVKITRKEIQKRSLALKHLLFEVGRIHGLLPEKLLPLQLPGLVVDSLLNSDELPIPSSATQFFTDSSMHVALSDVDKRFPKLRLFTMSIIGTPAESKRKAELLGAMFGSPLVSAQERVLGGGLSMRLVFLSAELAEEVGLDAILLLNSEAICQTHEAGDCKEEDLDRTILAQLLATTDLLLICSSKQSEQSLCTALEMALIKLLRLDTEYGTLAPDLMFVNFADEDTLTPLVSKMLDRLTLLFSSLGFELGEMHPPNFLFSQMRERIKSTTLTQHLGSTARIGVSFLPAEVQSLMDKILSQKELVAKSMIQWVASFRDVGKRLKSADKFPAPFPALDETMEKVILGIASIKQSIHQAAKLHSQNNDFNLVTKMTAAHSEANVQKQKSELMDEILVQTGEIFSANCRQSELSVSSPCEHCLAGIQARDELLNNFEAYRQLVLEDTDWHANCARSTILRKVEQMLFVLECAPPGESFTFPPADGLSSIQLLSTKVSLVPGERSQETDDLYSKVSTHMRHLIQSPMEDRLFERLDAFEEASSTGSRKMDWQSATELRNRIEELPAEIYRARNASTYEWGMIRDLQDQVKAEMRKIQEKQGPRKFLSRFLYVVHALAIARFNAYTQIREAEWNLDYDPRRFAQQSK